MSTEKRQRELQNHTLYMFIFRCRRLVGQENKWAKFPILSTLSYSLVKITPDFQQPIISCIYWVFMDFIDRFVLPVLPITLMFSGYLLAEIDKPDFPQRKLGKSDKAQKSSSWKYFMVFGLLITNIPAALYTSLVHQVFVLF